MKVRTACEAPKVLWMKAPRAMRAMRGNALEAILTVLWVHRDLPQNTIKPTLPSNETYESKTDCNRTHRKRTSGKDPLE